MQLENVQDQKFSASKTEQKRGDLEASGHISDLKQKLHSHIAAEAHAAARTVALSTAGGG